jgi:4-hydroxybenzoate polyprenyltransferase
MLDYLRLLRTSQYSKNLFIFLPAFFAGQITHADKLVPSFYAFLGFSLLASSMYIINDCIDIRYDQEHPQKSLRPIASGKVSIKSALILAVLLLAGGIFVSFSLGRTAVIIATTYTAVNILYSAGLKHYPIIDVSLIAVGFNLRLFMGSSVTGIELTEWIVVMTFLLAFFLALAKRRDDVLIFEKTGKMMRKSIDGYNSRFLDTSLAIMAAIIIVAYLMYSLSPEVTSRMGSHKLYLTAVFVVLGVLRYLQLTFVEEKSGSPTWVLLNDRFTQINLTCWVAAFWLLIY